MYELLKSPPKIKPLSLPIKYIMSKGKGFVYLSLSQTAY